jgi:hypothetical protein
VTVAPAWGNDGSAGSIRVVQLAGVSVKREFGTGGGPPRHASAEVPSGPAVVEVLSELEQPVTAHRVRIYRRDRAEM